MKILTYIKVMSIAAITHALCLGVLGFAIYQKPTTNIRLISTETHFHIVGENSFGAKRILSFDTWEKTHKQIQKLDMKIPMVSYAEIRPERQIHKDTKQKLRWEEGVGKFNLKSIHLPDESARPVYETWIKRGNLKASPIGFSIRLEPARDG